MVEKIAIATIGREHYHTRLVAADHQLQADEPLDNGGQNLAPAPGDFLRLSLASCTAITRRMYSDRKGFKVDEINVRVWYETIEGKTVFHRSVTVTGEVDEQQRKRLLQIANACPIHKVLTNPIEVDTIFVD